MQAMFAAQLIGMLSGCFLAPATFQMFVAGQPNLGEPGSTYPAPFAQVYRNMAVVGVGGASELGKNCLWVSIQAQYMHSLTGMQCCHTKSCKEDLSVKASKVGNNCLCVKAQA